jgi:hypothetical protein
VIIAGGAAVTALLLAAVVLLALTLSELKTSREHIESQDAKAGALLRTTRPALTDVPQLAEDAKPVLRRAAPLLGSLLAARPGIAAIGARLPLFFSGVQGLVNEGVPLAHDLRASDLPGLVTDLRDSNLPGLAATLQSSDLPSVLTSLQGLITTLESGDRLATALDTSTSVLADVQARDLPQRAEASSRRLRKLLGVQLQAYSTLRNSLHVQRETLAHVRSIDERLGGTLPAVGGG